MRRFLKPAHQQIYGLDRAHFHTRSRHCEEDRQAKAIADSHLDSIESHERDFDMHLPLQGGRAPRVTDLSEAECGVATHIGIPIRKPSFQDETGVSPVLHQQIRDLVRAGRRASVRPTYLWRCGLAREAVDKRFHDRRR